MRFEQLQPMERSERVGRSDILSSLPCPAAILQSVGAQRQAHMSFARLLLEVARCVQRAEGDRSAQLLFAVGSVDLGPDMRDALTLAATAMIAGAIRRLHGVPSAELFVGLSNHCGEVRFSTVENSARLPCLEECRLVQRIIAPLGGLHDCRQQEALVETAFCFLHCHATERFRSAPRNEGHWA